MPSGNFAGGMAQGIAQGFGLSRQAAIENAYLKLQQQRQAMLEKQMQAQEEKLAYQELVETPQAVMRSVPELSQELGPAVPSFADWKSAPLTGPSPGDTGFGVTKLNREDFSRIAQDAMQRAGVHAERIRQEGYESNLDKILAGAEARAAAAAEGKVNQTRESLIRYLAQQVASRRIFLPPGQTIESMADSMLGGYAEDLPSAATSRTEDDALRAAETTDRLMRQIAETKRRLEARRTGYSDTGPVIGRVRRFTRALGINAPEEGTPGWEEQQDYTTLDTESMRAAFQGIKQQSGQQYALKELDQLLSMMPMVTDQDVDWWAKFNRAKQFWDSNRQLMIQRFIEEGKNVKPEMPKGWAPTIQQGSPEIGLPNLGVFPVPPPTAFPQSEPMPQGAPQAPPGQPGKQVTPPASGPVYPKGWIPLGG